MVNYTLWGTNVDIQIPKETFPSEADLKLMDEVLCNPTHGFFPTIRGKLHYRYNAPKTPQPKAVVVWQHGIQGYGGKGFIHSDGSRVSTALLIQSLTDAGMGVYTLDMYGHGFSEGHRFFIPESNYMNNCTDLIDFTTFVSKEYQNKGMENLPLFLAGESYGGTLTIHAAKFFQDHPDKSPSGFRGIGLIAPAIIGDLPSKPVVLLLRYILAPMFAKWQPFFMPNPVSADRIWRDKEAYDHFTAGIDLKAQLHGGGRPFSLGTAVGLLTALESVRKIIPELTVPYCVLHGQNDYAVKVSGTEYLQKHAKSTVKEIHIVDGALHDLLSDPTRHEAVKTLIQWITSRI